MNLGGRLSWWAFGKWRHHYREWRSQNAEIRRAYPVVRCVGGRIESHSRRALLCYILDPFLDGYDPARAHRHSNHWHVIEIVKILYECGFAVDVTDYRNRRAPDGCRYDLVVGLDVGFATACRRARKRTPPVKLLLGTGAQTDQVAEAENGRLRALASRRGAMLRRRCRRRADDGPDYANAIAVVGNEWVLDTYRKRCDAALFAVPNTIIDGVVPVLAGKDFPTARKRFLWLASYAAVSRGLDVCLEVFRDAPDLELFVCGNIAHEKDFTAIYQHELKGCTNIHEIGWVDVTSREFQELVRQCAFILYPSASDGMPGSVINGMAAGLIPVVTEAAGVDTGGFGHIIQDCTPECVMNIVRTVSERDAAELDGEAKEVLEFTRRRYSKDAFSKAFRQCLDATLAMHE